MHYDHRNPYAWVDPFEVVSDTRHKAREWVEDKEREADERLRWALVEISRHRVLVDQALFKALQKYAPATLDSVSATMLMDGEISLLITRAR